MIGQTLNNRYRVTAQLGRGAMGLVYRATDKQTKQEVALKVIAGDLALDAEMLERFRREGEALRKLRHRSIVAFVEMFAHQGQQVIVMEYMGGGNLHSLIQQGALPLAQAREIALDLSDALICAHRLNIIHRDIKPENVLLAEDGTPKLTDFGVARLLEAGTRLTGSGTQVGTPYYMCPEAWEGKSLDVQADVWSLGVVLYEMLTGQVPFGGGTMVAVMNKVLTAPLPDLAALRPDVPSPLVQVVGRALTRDKAQRYPTVRQMSAELEQCVLPAPEITTAQPAKDSGTLPVAHALDTPVPGLMEGAKSPAVAAAMTPKRTTPVPQAPPPAKLSDEQATQVKVGPAVARLRRGRTGIYVAGAVLMALCLLAVGGLGIWGVSRFLAAQPTAVAVRPTEMPTLTETSAPPTTTSIRPATLPPATPVEVTRIVQQAVTVTPEPRKVTYTYKNMVVGFIQTGSEGGWRAANTASFKETATQLGINLKFYDAQNRLENQVSAFKNFIQDKDVNVIVIAALETSGWDDVLKQAQAAGKIVVIEDRRIDASEDLYATYIGSDFAEEGRKAAEEMCKLLEGSAKKNVWELVGNVGSSAAKDRGQGFREKMGDCGIQITQSQTGNWSATEGKTVTEAWLKQSTNVQGIFAQNDEMGLGAAQAIKEAGLKPGTDIKILTVDATAAAFKAMIAGDINTVVECNPLLAPQVYEAALKALNGESLPKWVPSQEGVFYAKDAKTILPTRKY